MAEDLWKGNTSKLNTCHKYGDFIYCFSSKDEVAFQIANRIDRRETKGKSSPPKLILLELARQSSSGSQKTKI